MIPLRILSFAIFASAWSFFDVVDGDEIEIGGLMHFFPLQFKKELFSCPAIYGRYPHERDCSMFYECRHGYPHLMKCVRGKLYDQKREQCNDQRRVTCNRHEKDNKDGDHDHDQKELEKDEQSKIFKCPYIWGTFPHPIDCSKYFVCVYNIPGLFECYGSNLYDERSRKCIDKRRVKCGKRLDKDQLKTSKKPYVRTTSVRPTSIRSTSIRSTSIRPTSIHSTSIRPKYTTTEMSTTEKDNHKFRCPFPNGRFADPSDCSQFYECRSIVPTLHKCSRSTLYDERKEECLKDKYVRCGNRPGGVSEDDRKKKELRCPYLWGTFPHPEDCSKYLICIYGVPTVFNCGKYDLFHAFKRRCFPKDQVTCDYGINPDDPSPQTPKPTTILISTTTPATKATPTATPRPTTTIIASSTPGFTTTSTTNRPTTRTPVSTTISTTPITTTTFTTTSRASSTTPTASITTTTTQATTATQRPITSTTTTQTTTTTPRPITSTTTTQTTTTTPRPITSSTIPTTLRRTSTASTSRPNTTIIPTEKTSTTPQSTTKVPKPNTPPPTDCEEGDLDCIIDGTGDVIGWFDCPERYGHFLHGSSHQLFIHCDNWHPFVKKCADGTVFSSKYLVCTWLE